MTNKIYCDLVSCDRKFTPTATHQRFCSVKHRNRFHQLERARLIKIAREMGIRK